MPFNANRVPEYTALTLAIVVSIVYEVIWASTMSFGAELKTVSDIYIVFYPLLILPIVGFVCFARAQGFALFLGYVLIGAGLSATTNYSVIFDSPQASGISFIPWIVVLMVFIAFGLSRWQLATKED